MLAGKSIRSTVVCVKMGDNVLTQKNTICFKDRVTERKREKRGKGEEEREGKEEEKERESTSTCWVTPLMFTAARRAG